MPKNTSSELLSRLKTSLPKPEDGTFPSPPTSTSSPTPQPLPALRPTAPKLSVSLYLKDLERLDEIKAFMQQHGFRNLSDSEALRLACRAVIINEQFLEIYRSMQSEDGRRKPGNSFVQNKNG